MGLKNPFIVTFWKYPQTKNLGRASGLPKKARHKTQKIRSFKIW
jgi:hypothetical protein